MSVCLSPKGLHPSTRHKLKRGFLQEFFSCAPVPDDFSRRYVGACPRTAPKTAHTFLPDCGSRNPHSGQNCQRENNIQLRSKVDVSLIGSQSFQKRSTYLHLFAPLLLVPHQEKTRTRVTKSLLFPGCKLFFGCCSDLL